MLTVRLTRISNTQHRFEYLRAGGGGKSALLETPSLLLHELIHLAVESEAGLSDIGGISVGALRVREKAASDQTLKSFQTERLRQECRDPVVRNLRDLVATFG